MRALGLVLATSLAILSLAPAARAETLETIFSRANAAYFRGDYDEAADQYRKLLDAGVLDPDVSYNLGATEAQRGRYGHAIHQLERALWLRPGDADAERALADVRAALGARRAAARGEAEIDSGSFGRAVFGGMSVDSLAWAAIVLNALLFLSLGLLWFVRRESARIGLGVFAVVASLGFLVSVSGLAVQSGFFDEGEPAVVLSERVPLREGPDPQAKPRHHAPEGHRAWVLDREREWVRVRVSGVGEGWMERSQLGLIQREPG